MAIDGNGVGRGGHYRWSEGQMQVATARNKVNKRDLQERFD